MALRLELLDSRAVDAKRFQGKKTRGRQLKACLAQGDASFLLRDSHSLPSSFIPSILHAS